MIKGNIYNEIKKLIKAGISGPVKHKRWRAIFPAAIRTSQRKAGRKL
jgi:hypothetical protein